MYFRNKTGLYTYIKYFERQEYLCNEKITVNTHILSVQLTFWFNNLYFPSQLETAFENVILFSFKKTLH
jgi:hypothetical protein